MATKNENRFLSSPLATDRRCSIFWIYLRNTFPWRKKPSGHSIRKGKEKFIVLEKKTGRGKPFHSFCYKRQTSASSNFLKNQRKSTNQSISRSILIRLIKNKDVHHPQCPGESIVAIISPDKLRNITIWHHIHKPTNQQTNQPSNYPRIIRPLRSKWT